MNIYKFVITGQVAKKLAIRTSRFWPEVLASNADAPE